MAERKKAQFLVKCTQSGCGAKAGPLEDKHRCREMAMEHAISFKHVTELHKSVVLAVIDPAKIARLTK